MSLIKEYWDHVASLGCCVTRSRTNVTIHHVHGGSVRTIVQRGRGIKGSDWLVIPLIAELHTGAEGVDSSMGVSRWERRYGSQLYHLLWVGDQLKVNPFDLSGVTVDIVQLLQDNTLTPTPFWPRRNT